MQFCKTFFLTRTHREHPAVSADVDKQQCIGNKDPFNSHPLPCVHAKVQEQRDNYLHNYSQHKNNIIYITGKNLARKSGNEP